MTVETKILDANSSNLESVKAIYEYLYKTFVDSRATTDEQRRLKERFQNRPCLWDESTGKFWKPIHAFQDDVPFFGSRRVTIPFSHRTGEVYQLLGQRRSPGVEDYLAFLQELAEEYNSNQLNEEDTKCALQVLQRLESQLSLEGGSAKNLPVLTADNQLCPASEVLIPDAPWRKDYIDRNRLLHSQVSPKLAKSAGSLSLLRDVIELPTEVKTALNTNGNDWCQEWQRTLNSPELQTGVKRLIFHEHDSEPGVDITWLATLKVQPASQIKVNLLLKDETPIASAIPGTYYFDEQEKILYIISCGSKYIMLCYLAESLNNQLGQYAVQNLLPLASILDAEPRNISGLLNELRIRSLPGDDNSSIPSTTLEEWDTLGEQWTISFYKWLGYTSILKQDAKEGFDFLCTGLGMPEIKAKVKAVNSQCPTIRIKSNEWSTMLKLGKEYELLIVSYQGDMVNDIIQISDIWSTLSYAESQLGNRLPTEAALPDEEVEFLMMFSSDSDKTHDDLILNWHRLVEGLNYEKIQKYRPIPSSVSYVDETVKFAPI